MLAKSHSISGGSDAGDGSGEQPASTATTTGAATTGADCGRTLGGATASASTATGSVRSERELDFDFAVLRECPGAIHEKRAAGTIDAIVAGTETAGRTVTIAKEEVGCVNQNVAVAFGGDGEAEED
jgi:hypothetical protein